MVRLETREVRSERFTSTSGDVPDTSTDSVTPPTASDASTVVCWLIATSTARRLTALKPLSSNLTS